MLANGSNITTVGHYKDAAERHLQVCEILFRQLDFPQNFKNINKYKNIAAELYYLSGYIVECSINYKYLVGKGFLDTEDYYQRHRWDVDVHIRGHFRFLSTNNPSCEKILQTLSSTSVAIPNYLQNLGRISTLTLLGSDAINEKMQKYWDPSIRYSYESTGLRFASSSIDEVKTYFKATKKLFNDLI